MSDRIPVLLKASNYKWPGNGFAGVFVGVDPSPGPETPYTSATGDNVLYFCVLDRADPTKKAVFNAAAPDSTTVPPGIEKYMDENHILLVAAAPYVTATPQGDLYAFIHEHGGGQSLAAMEQMGAYFACGVGVAFGYLMVSIPTSGLPGIEHLDTALKSNASMLVDLVPTSEGYVPVPVWKS